MTNEIKIFSNEEFNNLRMVIINGEPWFVGKDVATILGYERGSKAIVDRVDEEDRLMIDSKTQSQLGIELGQRGGWLINESGLYSLILSSKLPSAKRFKRWVTKEVFPTIHKTGGYVNNSELFIESMLSSLSDDNSLLRRSVENMIMDVCRKTNILVQTTPNQTALDIWKKHNATPYMESLSDKLKDKGIEKDVNQCYKLVYDGMRTKYRFEPCLAIMKFKDKYLENTKVISTIDTIADNEVCQSWFVDIRNEYLNRLDSLLTNSLKSDSNNKTVEDKLADTSTHNADFKLEFTINDDYDFILMNVAALFDDTKRYYMKTARKIYKLMNTDSGWKHSLTRNHCQTKKALIEKRPKYKKQFVDVCNELTKEAMTVKGGVLLERTH